MTRNASPGVWPAGYRSGPDDPRESPVRFGLVELDLLATYARAPIPFPLRVPSFGRFPGERDVLFAIAGATMRHRALADEDGPTGLGDQLATALAGRSGTVDLVLTGTGDPGGVVAIIHGDHALLCRQTLSDAATELVEVRRVHVDGLADAVVGQLPPLPGAKTMPVRVPTAAARGIFQSSARSHGGPGNRLFQVAARYGCSVEDLDALVQAGNAVTGGGQLGATVVSEHGRDVRAGAELSWVDGPAGRLRIAVEPGGGHGWVSVNPLHPKELRAAVADLAALAGRRRRH